MPLPENPFKRFFYRNNQEDKSKSNEIHKTCKVDPNDHNSMICNVKEKKFNPETNTHESIEYEETIQRENEDFGHSFPRNQKDDFPNIDNFFNNSSFNNFPRFPGFPSNFPSFPNFDDLFNDNDEKSLHETQTPHINRKSHFNSSVSKCKLDPENDEFLLCTKRINENGEIRDFEERIPRVSPSIEKDFFPNSFTLFEPFPSNDFKKKTNQFKDFYITFIYILQAMRELIIIFPQNSNYMSHTF